MKTFIVLGMHRSATSLVAGGIEEMGVDVGGNKVLLANEHNPAGYFENIDFILLNDRILSSAGGDWKNPPSHESILSVKKEYEEEIKFTIKKNEAEVWGWKDPRTVLTIDLYLPHLENPFFLTCFRSPLKVAQSLKKRDGMPIEDGIKLAELYNNRLLNFLNNKINK